MNISKDAVAAIEYTLKTAAGELVDSSEGSGPLAYLHGHGNLIEGMEEGLDGRKAGEAFELVVEPDKGYGTRDERMIQAVERSTIPSDIDLQVGLVLQVQSEQGVSAVTVTALTDNEVTLDGNHPLAGETLHFEVSVVEVRPATEEELSHGHVHGPGGHEH